MNAVEEISAAANDVATRARRRIAARLLPFVFLIYIVNYIDRVNVSFANLRMSAELGFSDKVYGLGVGVFYLTYVLFEIPGAILATVLWLAATSGFGWYVRHVGNYNVMYGSIGAGIALLVWMYLTAAIALIGCEFNAEYERSLRA